MIKLRQFYWKILEVRLNWKCFFLDYLEQLHVFFLFISREKKQSPLVKNQSNKKMLFISFYSPPYASFFGTQRLTKFLKYWSRLGWGITLLTTEPKPDTPLDISKELEETNVHIARITATNLKSRYLGKKQFVPDNYIHWVKPAIKAADQLISSEKPSVIVATVPPYSNAIAATICAKKYSLPLIIDFRDPWTCIDISWVIHNRFLHWLNALMEKRVLNFSRLILIADDVDYLPSFFPNGECWRHKVKSITNGYDEEDFEKVSIKSNYKDFFKISYIGGIYDEETFRSIINPIFEWAKQCPNDLSLVKLVYAGNSEYFDNNKHLPCQLENYGMIPHDKAIELRFKSQVQLFAQPKYFKPHIYSGKIFEMIRTPVPILAITNPSSSPARLIESTCTGAVFAHEDTTKSAAFLKCKFDLWKTGKTDYVPNKDKVARFSRKYLAENALNSIEQSIQE